LPGAACAALAALAAGCVQVDGEITLKADRSGSTVVTYVLGEQTIGQLREVSDAAARLAAASNAAPESGISAMKVLLDPRDATVRQFVGSLAPYGVTLTDLKIRVANGRRSVRMALAFSDFQKAMSAPALSDANVRLGLRGDGMWELAREGSLSTNGAVTAAAATALAPVFGGFSVKLKVKTPGPIMETTAPKKSPRAVAWEFDFNRDPQSVEQAFHAPLRVVYAVSP
jgi:hypothetical protein